MDIAGTGKRVRIYIGERDKAQGHHEPLWETLLDLLRREGAAGATMERGLAGFGAHSTLHVARLADVVPDLPVLIEWIDSPQRVDRLLPRVSDLVASGTITVEDVDIVKYAHRSPHVLPPDTVADVMTQQVATIYAGAPLGEAVRMLVARSYRALPVVDDQQRLVGILTNSDLVERGGLSARVELLAALGSPALERELASSGVRSKLVTEVMTREVTSTSPTLRLDAAAALMVRSKIKRLPVVDDQRHLLGILSRVDLLRTMGADYPLPEASQPEPREARLVRDALRREAPTVNPDAGLGAVLDAVTSTRLNRAIVVDANRRVVGLITDTALLTTLDPGSKTGLLDALMGRGRARAHGAAQTTARELMQTPVQTTPEDTPIVEALQAMLEAQHKLLLVTDAAGCLVGIADRADLLAHLSPSALANG